MDRPNLILKPRRNPRRISRRPTPIMGRPKPEPLEPAQADPEPIEPAADPAPGADKKPRARTTRDKTAE